MREENKMPSESSKPLDYRPVEPARSATSFRRLLRVRHDEPLNRWHVIIVLSALILLVTLLSVMITLFPQGG